MKKRKLGKTSLDITPLAFGSAQVGTLELSDQQIQTVLNGLLDAGINLVDSAACYGDAEKILGEKISPRRDEYVLVTKCGHSTETQDPPSWSPQIIHHSAERSLRLMQTDHLDVLLLHSCSADKLTDELLDALAQCKQKGITRFIGYSGDGDDALRALENDLFDVFETSISICDQQVLDSALPKAAEKNLGVITKRTLANVCWMQDKNTSGFYAGYVEPYRKRFEQMGLTTEKVGFDGSMLEMALRFTVYQPGVSSAIIGTTDLEHIKENIKMIEKGPLEDDVIRRIRDIWKQNDDGSWTGRT